MEVLNNFPQLLNIVHDNIRQVIVKVEELQKGTIMHRIVKSLYGTCRIAVLCEEKTSCLVNYHYLRKKDIRAIYITADLGENCYSDAIWDVANGNTNIVVITLNMLHVLHEIDFTHVISMDFPNYEQYYNILKRTGAINGHGMAITFYEEHDDHNNMSRIVMENMPPLPPLSMLLNVKFVKIYKY